MSVASARGGWGVTGVVTGLIVVIATGAFALGFARLRSDAVSDLLEARGTISVVIMLPIDELHPSFEVLMLDSRTGRAALMFVPGSIGVVLHDPQRIDAIAELYDQEGHDVLAERLSKLLDLDLDFYLDLSYEGLGRLIDVLGGVEVVIPDPVQFTVGDRRLLLPSGSVVVDGDMARDYLSFRMEEEPASVRVERVHRLTQGLLRAVADSGAVLADPTAQRMLYDAFVTDLSRRAFDMLVSTFVDLDTDRVILRRVLGRVQDVGDRRLLFPYNEGAVLRETIKQTVAALSVPLVDMDLSPSLEVLNGTRTSGLAAQAATVFESFGYRIVVIDNADHHDYERTRVIVRGDDPEQARQVAELIRCGQSESVETDKGAIASALDTVDVTVVLGRDFNGRFCQSR